MALTTNSSPVLVTPDSCGGNQAAMPALLLERMTHILEAQAQQAAGKFTSSNNLATCLTPYEQS
jgi:hypothetical protein